MTSIGTNIIAYVGDKRVEGELTNIYSKELEFIAVRSIVSSNKNVESKDVSIVEVEGFTDVQIDTLYNDTFKYCFRVFKNPDHDKRTVLEVYHNNQNVIEILDFIEDEQHGELMDIINALRLEVKKIERNLFINWIKRLFS